MQLQCYLTNQDSWGAPCTLRQSHHRPRVTDSTRDFARSKPGCSAPSKPGCSTADPAFGQLLDRHRHHHPRHHRAYHSRVSVRTRTSAGPC